MKKYYLLFALLLVIGQTIAQKRVECDFDNSTSRCGFVSDDFGTSSIDPNYLAAFQPVVFNLHFWGINKNNGTSQLPLILDDVLEVVANLNIIYNEYNVFFKYTGTDYFNSTTYYVIDGDESVNVFDYAASNGYQNVNAINFYVPYDALPYSGSASACKTALLVRSLRFKDWHSPHEMGHLFRLMHTYNGCERVTRDPLNPLFNADNTGDFVVDTASTTQWQDNVNVDPIECRYLETDRNCHDEPLEIFEQDLLNYMQQDLNDCRNPFDGIFTVGQAIRMREAIQLDEFNSYIDVTTTLAALYEPYDGIYKPCCWSFSEKPPLFQPGFDYDFVYCQDEIPLSSGRTEPWPWGDLSFTTGAVVYSFDKFYDNYDQIEHLNHLAIRISQIEDQPRRCYSNYSIASMSTSEANDELLNEPELVLFPNPTSNVLQIKYSDLTITEVSIYNRFGELMYSVPYAVPLLNMERLPNGLYFVSIATATDNFVKQIIKK